MGGSIGGSFISFVLAWIACGVRRKSRLGGAITFVVMLGVAAATQAQETSSNGSSTQPTASAFPLFGIAVGSPPGWQQLPPDRLGVATQWISPESRPGRVQGAIAIEMKKSESPDGGQTARSLAETLGGRVADKPESLDGETAWRVLAEPGTDLRPVETLLTIHDGRLYLIEGAVTLGNACHDQIEFIRQSWKWIPLDPPTKHLEFRDQPTIIFNNRVSINVPAAMYVFDFAHPERRLGFGLANNELGRDDFTATVEFGELPKGTALVNAEVSIAQGVQAKFNLPEAFVWRDLNSDGSTQSAMTQAVPGPASDRKNWIMWGIVGLPGTQIVLINFSIFAEDPNDRAIYAQTAEKIVESVSPAPAAKGP
jgi:hypothetical protein